MEINVQSVKLKIDHYCESHGMTTTQFAETIDLSRQALQNMLGGRQNFTQPFFLGVMRKHPEIDIYQLFDGNANNVAMVREDAAPYGDDKCAKMKAAIKEMKKLLSQF